MAVLHVAAARVVQRPVREDPGGDRPVPAGRAVSADRELLLPERPGGQVIAVEGVEDSVLVGHREKLVAGRVRGQDGRRAPVGVQHGGLERELPRALVLQRGRVEGDDRLRLGLGVVVQRAGGDEDGVGRRVICRRRPDAAADLAVRHEVVGVDDLALLRARDAYLQQLALDQRVVAVAGDPDVGVVAHDQRARPVVVGAGLAVVPGVDLPQDVARCRVKRVPVRPAAAHVEHAVHDRRRGGDPVVHRVASGVVGHPEVLLPDQRAVRGAHGVLVAVPRPHVRGGADDAHRGGDRPACRERELELQRRGAGHAQLRVDGRRGPLRVLQEHGPVLVGRAERGPRCQGGGDRGEDRGQQRDGGCHAEQMWPAGRPGEAEYPPTPAQALSHRRGSFG